MKTILLLLTLSGCASVTPENRFKVYSAKAVDFQVTCKAYRFDRSAGLVTDVPALSKLCP